MEEIWKDIEDYEGYQVSNFGRVRSLDRYNSRGYWIKGCILKPIMDKKGYLTVGLSKNNQRKTFKVHRLVALHFIPNIENKPEIDHINTIKTDNTVWLNEDGSVNYDKTNLRWVTPKENSNNPLSLVNNSESKKGIKNHRHQPVLQYDKDGNFIREWDTMTEAETTLNINHKIHVVCQGKRKTCGGYIWKYKRTA